MSDINKERKKQKPGLNGVRPDDYTEDQFKSMAKDRKLTQTQMFNLIFYHYINDEKNEHKNSVLNLEPEIDLISRDLGNLMEHFKVIADKAQNTVLSVKNNAEQTEKNLHIDNDTLEKKLLEITKRNDELEQFTSTFNDVKVGLESKVKELGETLQGINNKLKDSNDLNKKLESSNKTLEEQLNKSNKEKNRLYEDLKDSNDRLKRVESELKENKDINRENVKNIKEGEKQINRLENNNKDLTIEINRMKQEIASKDTTIRGLEASNNNLNTTISTIDKVHKAEMESVVAKYEEKISSQKTKMDNFEEEKENIIKQITSNLTTKYDSDKKSAVADMKLEMSKLYTEYTKTLNELNTYKTTIKK